MVQARSLGRDDLICSHYTLAGQMTGPGNPSPIPFADRVAAVAKAGYSGIGMMAYDYDALIQSGLSDADLRAVVDDHGISVAEIEFLSGWWANDERLEFARATEATLLHMAELFEPRTLVLGAGAESLDEADLEAAAERFAGVCDRAADHGLVVGMEFMGISTVKEIASAGRIAMMADRPNGGIALDTYHYFRSTSTEADLRAVGGNRITCVQYRDAAGPGEWSLEEVTGQNLLPGEGDFDIVGLVRTLDDMGVTAPATVEILSEERWSLPLDEQASTSHDATRAVLAEARS